MEDKEIECKGRFPNWCLTLWPHREGCNKGDADIEFNETEFFDRWKKKDIKIPSEKLKYMVAGLERCPEGGVDNGKLHIHYYIEFTEKVSRKWIKEMLSDNSCWANPRNGTQKQAIDYVKKDETKVFIDENKFIEIGEKKSQGNRSDLDTMVDAIENGMTSKEILHQFRGNALRHFGMIRRGLIAYHNLDEVDRYILFNRGEGELFDENETKVILENKKTESKNDRPNFGE